MRHDLDEWIAAYLEGAGLTDAPQASPLFRAGQRRASPLDRSGHVTSRRATDAQAPAARPAGLPKILSPHSFRVLVVPRPALARTCRSRTSSTSPGTPIRAPPRFMTGAAAASAGIWWSGSPFERMGIIQRT